MAPLAFMPPNTPSHYRSERIPNEIWAQHKEDLIREFHCGGIKKTLDFITNQKIPDFSPSYRQLRRQLHVKWQVSETNVNDDQTYAPTTATINGQLNDDNGDVGCKNEINEGGINAADTPITDIGLRRHPILLQDDSTTEVTTQSDDHSKVSLSIQEDNKRQSGREKRKTDSSLRNDEPSKKKRKEMQQLPHGPCHQVPPSYEHPISSEQAELDTNAKPTRQHTSALTEPCQEPNSNVTINFESIRSNSESVSFSTELEISKSWSIFLDDDHVFDTEILKIDYKRPISSYSSKDIERIKNAAEYLFCCSYCEDAFRLFYIVWKRSEMDLSTPGSSSPKENFKAIIPLARAATSQMNREIMRDLLRQKLTNTKIFLDKLLLEFIMRIWELSACHTSNQTSEGKEIISFPDLAHILHSRISDTSFTVKWLTVFVLVFHECRPAVEITSPSVSLCIRALEDFLSPPEEHIFGMEVSLFTSRIRILFISCREYLRDQVQLLSPWKSFRQHSIDKNWADSMGIFSHLWRLWYECKSRNNLFDGAQIGFESIEKATGISVAELLRVCAFLILRLAPVENRSVRRLSISRYLEDKEGDLLRRARAGVDVLCGMKHSQLSNLFAIQFVQLTSSTLISRQDNGPRFTVHMTPKNFVQKPLQIILPTMILPLPRRSDIRREMKCEEDGHSEVRSIVSDGASMALSGRYDPTFASSLTSSSFSSFRRGALSVKQDLNPFKPPSLSNSSRPYSGIDDLSETFSELSMTRSVRNLPSQKQRNR